MCGFAAYSVIGHTESRARVTSFLVSVFRGVRAALSAGSRVGEWPVSKPICRPALPSPFWGKPISPLGLFYVTTVQSRI
jgi:hypothetical protein